MQNLVRSARSEGLRNHRLIFFEQKAQEPLNADLPCLADF